MTKKSLAQRIDDIEAETGHISCSAWFPTPETTQEMIRDDAQKLGRKAVALAKEATALGDKKLIKQALSCSKTLKKLAEDAQSHIIGKSIKLGA